MSNLDQEPTPRAPKRPCEAQRFHKRKEEQSSGTLDQPEAHGVLQRRNQMDLAKELLNPIFKQELVGKVSEEEIFKSVQDMLQAEQMMEVNRGDDVDEDTVQANPTRKEALLEVMAAFTLRKYIADMNEPFASNILASFGHQTRLEDVRMMETTYILTISLISSLDLIISYFYILTAHGDHPIMTSFGTHTL